MSKKTIVILHIAFWSISALISWWVLICTWIGGVFIFLSPGTSKLFWLGLWLLLPLFAWLLLATSVLMQQLTGKYLIIVGIVSDILALFIAWSFFWQKHDVLIGQLGLTVAIVFIGLWWLLVSSRLNPK